MKRGFAGPDVLLGQRSLLSAPQLLFRQLEAGVKAGFDEVGSVQLNLGQRSHNSDKNGARAGFPAAGAIFSLNISALLTHHLFDDLSREA